MSPAGTTHGTIQSNIARLLGNHLAVPGSRCRIVTEPAISTRVRAGHNLRIPDLAVSCTPDAAGAVVLPDPILLIEILSPSNVGETWENIWAYASIPSVREILIVQSTRIESQILRRQDDGTWPSEPAMIASDQSLSLASISLSLPLASLYIMTHLLPA